MSIGNEACVVENCDTPYERRRNCEHCGDVVCWDHLTNFCDVCATQEYPFTYLEEYIHYVQIVRMKGQNLPEGVTRASLHGYCADCEEEIESCDCN